MADSVEDFGVFYDYLANSIKTYDKIFEIPLDNVVLFIEYNGIQDEATVKVTII